MLSVPVYSSKPYLECTVEVHACACVCLSVYDGGERVEYQKVSGKL